MCTAYRLTPNYIHLMIIVTATNGGEKKIYSTSFKTLNSFNAV
jgi:hypothetical protein